MFCTKCSLIRTTCTNVLKSSVSSMGRFNSTNAATETTSSMNDIPSPRGLPLIGTTLSLMLAGSTPKLHWYIDRRHKQLGPIFKENVGPVPCVFISDSEAMRAVFAHEGKCPIHLLPEAWTTYNTLHNVSRGLFFMNGEEWLHFRRIMNPLLLKGDQSWIEDCCKPGIDNLVKKIRNIFKNSTQYPNMEQLLYKWSLDVMVSVLLGPHRYLEVKDSLEKQIMHLASNVHLVFETSSKLALIPSGFAAKYRIPRWKRFESSVTIALQSASDLVETLSNYCVKEGDGLLGKLRGQMTSNELSKIVTDLILAAGDTTAYSMEWSLYLVGRNRNVQEKLKQELKFCRNEGLPETSNNYLKNVIKESLRLYPVAPFLTRILPEQVTVGGYTIPAGTILILSIFTSGRDEKNFPNPEKFDPDRWGRSDKRIGVVQSASLPFAIGARSCIGKKLAETQLQLTLAEIVNNFDVKVCNKKEVDVTLKMVAVPSEDIKFRFTSIT